MGIDIYLRWSGMTEEDEQRQYTGMSIIAGDVGYLREAYHGGPYATKILVREAFDAENCEAEIPAAILRERLTSVTEPTYGANGGHDAAKLIADALKASGMIMEEEIVQDGVTRPMSVEEAVRIRMNTLYPETEEAFVEEVVQSFRNFVALAEQKERETGQPCTVIASY